MPVAFRKKELYSSWETKLTLRLGFTKMFASSVIFEQPSDTEFHSTGQWVSVLVLALRLLDETHKNSSGGCNFHWMAPRRPKSGFFNFFNGSKCVRLTLFFSVPVLSAVLMAPQYVRRGLQFAKRNEWHLGDESCKLHKSKQNARMRSLRHQEFCEPYRNLFWNQALFTSQISKI